MAMSDRILLVEGDADKSFFEEICKTVGLHPSVTVAPPKDIGGTHNTREGVLNYFPILLNQLGDGTVKNLAIIIDADSDVNGGGYQRAIDKVAKKVKEYGFTQISNPVAGIIFQHNDGLADFGLWVMPNNCDEGMLEDWIKSCVHSNESDLFTHAQEVVDALSQPKFNPIHTSKAEVATWLAWQKKPGHGLYHAVEEKLIDTTSELFKELCVWLTHVYGSED